MLLAFGPFQDLDLFNYLGNEIVEAQGLTKESRCKYLLLLLCKTHYNSCSRASFFFFLYLATILLVLSLEYTI